MGKLKMKWNEEVDKVCPVCDRHFTVLAYRLKQGRGKFCSRSCRGHAIAPHIHHHPSAETKGKIAQTLKERGEILRKQRREQTQLRVNQACSEGMKEAWRDPKRRATMLKSLSVTHKKVWANPEFKARMSQIRKELWLDPEFRAMMSNAQSKRAKRNWQNPEYRKHQIEAQMRKWQRPEYVAKMMASLHKSPNKPEQRLIDIFSKSLPQFKYNGDFSLGVMLGRLTPDFVNINGKKQVIEFFGDYYHSPDVIGNDWRRGELGKVMIYNSLGWKCLIIWERELSQLSDEEVTERVKTFFRR